MASHISVETIDIRKTDITKSVKNLTAVLANEMVLYIKTRKFHWSVSGNWNMSGKSFVEFHKLFESHYNSIELIIDDIIERINKLNAKPSGIMSGFIEPYMLREGAKNDTQEKMLLELLNDHERMILNLRGMISEMEKDADDFGIADFLKAIIQGHDYKARTLRICLSE
ncbi:Dps family protein [Confluentibacter citreus]|uniref:Dps family protein n=1 Tax=Confluentibacter citreus TaxID=2007307 RepID=UPI000C28850A|nr:ferritin-like domain-containing protein [Confluentibacter citreus]